MPQKKLDEKRLEKLKTLLFKLKEELVHDIVALSETNSGEGHDVSGHVLHMADVATDMYDKEFALGLSSRDRELLQKIDNALKRIEEGTYGLCLETGKPISCARLEAIPYAEYCLEYQEEIESKL